MTMNSKMNARVPVRKKLGEPGSPLPVKERTVPAVATAASTVTASSKLGAQNEEIFEAIDMLMRTTTLAEELMEALARNMATRDCARIKSSAADEVTDDLEAEPELSSACRGKNISLSPVNKRLENLLKAIQRLQQNNVGVILTSKASTEDSVVSDLSMMTPIRKDAECKHAPMDIWNPRLWEEEKKLDVVQRRINEAASRDGAAKDSVKDCLRNSQHCEQETKKQSSRDHAESRQSPNKAKKPKRKTFVAFSDVSVRHYERVMCENPACSSGPGVGLGWKYEENAPLKLKEWEVRRGRRRTPRELVLSRSTRETIIRGLGYTDWEIARTVRSTMKSKYYRRKTANNLRAQKVEEAIESAKRKVEKMLNILEKKNSEALRIPVAQESLSLKESISASTESSFHYCDI